MTTEQSKGQPKKDSRPQRYGWAPGKYLNTCIICNCSFIGDKRAVDCADCAYALPEPSVSQSPPTTLSEERLREYIGQLFTNWCECSPYGEQVPDEWPELMAQFVKVHAGKDRDFMAELIADGNPDDCFEKLLENIFMTACRFVLSDLSQAVEDENADKLAVIGLRAAFLHAAEQMARSEAKVTKLRMTLAFVLASAQPNGRDNPAMYCAWQEGMNTLTETLPPAPEKQEGGQAA